MANPFGAFGGTPTSAQLLHVPLANPAPERVKAGVGSSSNAATYTSAGFKLVLRVMNRNLATEASTPPADYTAYRTAITDIIAHYGAGNLAAICVEDEPAKLANFNGTSADLAAMVGAAYAVAHPLGVRVVAGPFSAAIGVYGTYQDLIDRGLTAEAADYWTNAATGTMTTGQARAQSNILKGFLDQLKTVTFDYVGAKQYSPHAVWGRTASFYQTYMANGVVPVLVEYAQQDTDTATTDELFDEAVNAGTPIVVLQTQGSAVAQPLTDGTPALTAIGTEWLTRIQATYEQTGADASCLFGFHAEARPNDASVITSLGGTPAPISDPDKTDKDALTRMELQLFPTRKFGADRVLRALDWPLPDGYLDWTIGEGRIPVVSLRSSDSAGMNPFGLMGPHSMEDAIARRMIPVAPGWTRVVHNLADGTNKVGCTPATAAAMKAAGWRITFTLRWLPNGPPAPFPGDVSTGVVSAEYIASIPALMTPYLGLVEHVVVEDEETTQEQVFGTGGTGTDDGDAALYAAMVQAVVDYCHPHGIPVSNGGYISGMSTYMTYQDLVDQGRQTEADAFWSISADHFEHKSDAPAKAARGRAFLTATLATGIDIINFHKYVPDRTTNAKATGGAATIAAYFARVSGLPVISNEWGVRDKLADSPVLIAQDLAEAGCDLAVCYVAGTGPGGAASLWDDIRTGTLDANGQAYADWQVARYGSGSASATTGTVWPFADVAAGLHDDVIDAWAAELNRLAVAFPDVSVYLGFQHVPSQTYAASGETLTQTKSSYRAAFARVHDRFVSAGVTNVIWTCILGSAAYDPIRANGVTSYDADGWYPGDPVVDVLGTDQFNPFGATSAVWRDFSTEAQNFVAWARANGNARLMVGEMGTLEDSADATRKASWLAGVRSYLEESVPEVEAACYLTGGAFGWWVETPTQGSPQALVEFNAMGSDPYFGGSGPAPAPRSLISLTLRPTQVAGGDPAIGTVFINAPALSGGTEILLSSDKPDVSVPRSVTVTEGGTSVDFAVLTAPVVVETTATITATVADLGGSSLQATLVVGSSPGSSGAGPGLYEFSYNDLTFGGDGIASSIDVESVEGLGDYVLRQDVDQKGAQHGAFTFARYLAERRVIISGLVFGPTRQDRSNLLAAIDTAFPPDDVERPLKFQLGDGVVKRITAKTTRKDVPVSKHGGSRMLEFTLELLAGDPLIYEAAVRTLVLMPVSAGNPGLAIPALAPFVFAPSQSAYGFAVNIGVIDAPMKVRFTGPSTNPAVTNPDTEELLRVNVTLGADDTLDVDFGNQTVILNGTTSRFTSLDPASTFFWLPPGKSRLSFIADATDEGASATVVWSSTWPAAR